MLILEGTIRIKDLARARPYMEALIKASRAEKGCIDYAFAIDLMDAHLIHISERWENLECLGKHGNSQHLKTWRASFAEAGVSDRSIRLYEAEPQVV